jgi:hypothetical protein
MQRRIGNPQIQLCKADTDKPKAVMADKGASKKS